MNINDEIFFSPKYKMSCIDLNNKEIMLEAFKDRIEGYYLEPIKVLNEKHMAFAAGTLLFSSIDIFARYSVDEQQVGKRIRKWLITNVNSHMGTRINNQVSRLIYDNFRNGLIHEGHLKNAAQFSYEYPASVKKLDKFIIINPKILEGEVNVFFNKFVNDINNDDNKCKKLIQLLKQDFEAEKEEFKKWERNHLNKKYLTVIQKSNNKRFVLAE